jgi:hypothetical protein
MNIWIVAGNRVFCHNGGMSEVGDSSQNIDLPQTSVPTEGVVDGKEIKKIGVVDRVGLALVRYMTSPTRLRELSAAGTMYGIESMYDMRKVAREGNEWGNQYPGLTAENVGPLPQDPNVRAAFDVMGDMWEISVGQSVVRGGLHVLYRSIGKELLSDDDTFALSLLVPLVLKSAHTMGLISIFGIHDHMDNPVPKMLIGQIVSSCVLMAAHYSARNNEIRKSLGIPKGQSGFMKLVEKGVRTVFEGQEKLLNPQKRVEKSVANLAIASNDESVE